MTPVEINQIALARAKFELPGHTWFEQAYAIWGYSSRPAGQTFVTACMFDEVEVRVQVDHVLRAFQDAGSHVNWFFGPSAQPSNLAKILRRERRLMGPMYLPAMSADLARLPRIVSRANLSAQLITDWDAVFEEGYPALEWYPKAAKDDAGAMAREFSGHPDAHYFAAYCDGFLASSCLLFVHDGIAGIYDVVTKPAFRNRGAATCAILAAHDFAIDTGCHLAILQSHKKATSLYRTLGYREIGNYVSMYYSRPRMAADLESRSKLQ